MTHGSLENIILNALWDIEGEESFKLIDVSEIQEKINSNEQNWAYTTVKTVLDRLVDKEIIERIKHGKKYSYRSVLSRDEMGEQALKKVLEQYYKGNIDELMKNAQKIRESIMVLA